MNYSAFSYIVQTTKIASRFEGWELRHGNYLFPSHLNDDTTKQECVPAGMTFVRG